FGRNQRPVEQIRVSSFEQSRHDELSDHQRDRLGLAFLPQKFGNLFHPWFRLAIDERRRFLVERIVSCDLPNIRLHREPFSKMMPVHRRWQIFQCQSKKYKAYFQLIVANESTPIV
ncbi:hypothetical protein, partial [Mesorhizobium sp. M0643]|uniref:hypothetical protein n=1 Tax=Mesorhizobium sp. M0643 TaxID=2956978 RepID=UPI0033353032